MNSNDPSYTCTETPENLELILSTSNNILKNDLGIVFDLKNMQQTYIDGSALDHILMPDSHLSYLLSQIPNYDPRAINGFFVHHIKTPRLHGKYYSTPRSFIIADDIEFPPVSRTLAHELAHVCLLRDLQYASSSSEKQNLLAKGTTGIDVTTNQVQIARSAALKLMNELG